MKKSVKIIMTAVILMLVISSTMMVFAAPNPNTYDGANANVDTSSISKFGQNIVSVVGTVGSIGAVVVLIVLGIKYMMGSAEEKAEYKKTLLPYIIGAVFVFAASSIASVIFGFASGSWG